MEETTPSLEFATVLSAVLIDRVGVVERVGDPRPLPDGSVLIEVETDSGSFDLLVMVADESDDEDEAVRAPV